MSRVNAAGIAYLDFGTDPTISSARLEPGFDFVNDDDFAEDESDSLQGANISRILLSDTSQSIIVPLKITSPGTSFTVERGDQALNYILGRPDIQVVNYNYLQPASLNLQRQVVANGKVIVVQSGDGGGIDSDQNISAQSNLAGDLKDNYMVAPISSPFTSTQSTAFAQAHVSAAAALVFEAAPFLTPQQVVEILLTSATDLGDTGVDSVYGNGALDVQAALDPVGITSVSTGGGNNDSGGSGSGAIIGLVLAGALGYALLGRSETLQKTLILDQYGRGYSTDLISAAPKLGDQSMQDLLGFSSLPTNHKARSTQLGSPDTNNGYRTTASLVYRDVPEGLAIDDEEADLRFSYSSEATSASGWGRHQLFNVSINSTLGVNADNTTLQAFNLKQSFSSPFLGFANDSSTYKLNHRTNNLTHQIGFALHDDQGRHGAASRSVLYDGVLDKNNAKLGLQIGYTNEDKSLYGSAANGPFSVDGAETLSLTVSGSYQLSPKLELVGSYSLGKTKVKAAANSLLTGFSTLSSQSSAVGLLSNSLFTSNDSLGLVYSKPLHFNSGQIDLHTPTNQLSDGSVLFADETISLSGLSAPVERLSLHYQHPINNRLSWSSKVVYQNGDYAQSSGSYGIISRLNLQL